MTDCIFCKIVSGEMNCHKVYEDEHTLAFLDIFPVALGHTLVIPKKHYKDMNDITPEDAMHVMNTVKLVIDLFREKLGLKDFNIINNCGAVAGQVVFHVHYHIAPRSIGDVHEIRMKWTQYPELREKFDELIKRIKE